MFEQKRLLIPTTCHYAFCRGGLGQTSGQKHFTGWKKASKINYGHYFRVF